MNPDFSKYMDQLVPAIVQDCLTQKVLMLGFMNTEAFEKTQAEKRVCFYSRSRKKLWTKGETSGNFLEVQEILLDCDNDSILIKASPSGPVCHTGADTCFNEKNHRFNLEKLEQIIDDRKKNPLPGSYTSSLYAEGINKIAQKLGEEAVELVIESKDNDRVRFLEEAADLIFHYLVLLKARDCKLEDVIGILEGRHAKSK